MKKRSMTADRSCSLTAGPSAADQSFAELLDLGRALVIITLVPAKLSSRAAYHVSHVQGGVGRGLIPFFADQYAARIAGATVIGGNLVSTTITSPARAARRLRGGINCSMSFGVFHFRAIDEVSSDDWYSNLSG